MTFGEGESWTFDIGEAEYVAEGGLRSNTRYRKSAGIVGEVLKNYHPHGEAIIYPTLVRMAQEWNMRYTLVDKQGNFGSQDGDGPAAMRYTEARLERIAESMLMDIEKDTVDFQLNFDDSLEEPSVLPTRIPNLLINGSSVAVLWNVAPAASISARVASIAAG